MSSSSDSSQVVEKRQYLNQTQGWLGVSVLSPLGTESSVSIPPGGTVWLSDDEAILTARAPASSDKNPFIPWTFLFVDPTDGKQVEREVTPLVAISDKTSAPTGDRPVPGVTDIHVIDKAPEASVQETPSAPPAASSPPPLAQQGGALPSQVTPAPGSAVPPVPADGEGTSWVDPDAPLTASPQPGKLGGEDGPGPGAGATEPEPISQPSPPVQPPVLQTPGSSPLEAEEMAAEHVGEETGAATPPQGSPPAGEYAQHEEVGTPIDQAGEGAVAEDASDTAESV